MVEPKGLLHIVSLSFVLLLSRPIVLLHNIWTRAFLCMEYDYPMVIVNGERRPSEVLLTELLTVRCSRESCEADTYHDH